MNVRDMIKWDELGGSLPVIVQCAVTMRIRYQCLLDEDSFARNLHERDRRHLDFGDEFENDAVLVNAFIDCDGDAALFQTRYHGAEVVFGRNFSHFQLGSPVTFTDEQELLSATIQQYGTCEVLMHAFINRYAFEMTQKTGFVHFWSRSREKLWKKGEESGHVQKMRDVRFDAENRTILIFVDQTAGACHTGYFSCFYREIENDFSLAIVGKPVFDPKSVYKKGR